MAVHPELERPYPEHRESAFESEGELSHGCDLSLAADDWLARSTLQPGSWWTHWLGG